MLDIHTKEFDIKKFLRKVNEETMFGTGQLPKFENDQFQLKLEGDKKYLIPTAKRFDKYRKRKSNQLKRFQQDWLPGHLVLEKRLGVTEKILKAC